MNIIVALRLLLALLLIILTYVVILPYFWRPEEFFIKSLRIANTVTHKQLLFRAFIGAGLISVGLQSCAFFLVLGLSADLGFEASLIPTLGGGLVVGIGSYIGFRFIRYRKMAPSGNFIRRDFEEELTA